jgi:hypothetical protein
MVLGAARFCAAVELTPKTSTAIVVATTAANISIFLVNGQCPVIVIAPGRVGIVGR